MQSYCIMLCRTEHILRLEIGAHLTFPVVVIFLVYGGRYLFYRLHSYLPFHFPSFRLSTSLSPPPPLFAFYPYLSLLIGLLSRSPIYLISTSFSLYIICTCAVCSYFICLSISLYHSSEKKFLIL